MPKTVEINGYCDPRFSAAKETFRQNLESGADVGASFAATIDGKFVVDIWGGYADAARTRPWERNTIVNVYSTTKVMTAICALMLVDRGQLDLDAPVVKYWPEFAQAGKEKIPVRYLLSHQAGLAVFEEPTPTEALYDWERITKQLAAQKPQWEPGRHSGYHALTFGYLLGEVVRRITGKTLGAFFRDEVAVPLNADFYIGLPAEMDFRVGELIPPPILKPGDPGYFEPPPDSVVWKHQKYSNMSAEDSKTRAWRGAEIPAANGHGNARSVAKIGAAMACGGKLDGVRLMGMPTIEKAIEEQCYGTDLFLGVPVRYGLGFGLNCKEMPLGPNPRAFTWFGWGGSKAVMDLDARLSWSYVMNKMVGGPEDRRGPRIADAIYAAL